MYICNTFKLIIFSHPAYFFSSQIYKKLLSNSLWHFEKYQLWFIRTIINTFLGVIKLNKHILKMTINLNYKFWNILQCLNY